MTDDRTTAIGSRSEALRARQGSAPTELPALVVAWSKEEPHRLGETALYRLTPHTGRTHQLRVQMSALGIPIVGDRIYPRLWPEPAPGEPPDWSDPLQLLAREIAFTDPVTGETRRFASRRRLALTGGLP